MENTHRSRILKESLDRIGTDQVKPAKILSFWFDSKRWLNHCPNIRSWCDLGLIPYSYTQKRFVHILIFSTSFLLDKTVFHPIPFEEIAYYSSISLLHISSTLHLQIELLFRHYYIIYPLFIQIYRMNYLPSNWWNGNIDCLSLLIQAQLIFVVLSFTSKKNPLAVTVFQYVPLLAKMHYPYPTRNLTTRDFF